MQTNGSSARAYDRLSALTEAYNEGQSTLIDMRVLIRVLRVLMTPLEREGRTVSPFYEQMLVMRDVALTERNRLYAEQKRQADEMDRLNALIQNGAYNEKK